MKTFIYVGYVVGILICLVGIYMIFAPPAQVQQWFVQQQISFPAGSMGVLVLLCGVFRLWRSRIMHRRMQQGGPR